MRRATTSAVDVDVNKLIKYSQNLSSNTTPPSLVVASLLQPLPHRLKYEDQASKQTPSTLPSHPPPPPTRVYLPPNTKTYPCARLTRHGTRIPSILCILNYALIETSADGLRILQVYKYNTIEVRRKREERKRGCVRT